jgi:hypothetical protein
MSDDADQDGYDSSDTAQEQGVPVDPLAGLIERLKLDVKAGFTDDVIEAAAILKRSDAGKFVELLRDLKAFKRENPGSGFSLTVFNKQVDRKLAEASAIIADPPDIATRLVELSLAATHFMCLENDGVFADFIVNDQLMTGAVRGTAYQRWLQMLFYHEQHRAPGRESLKTAISTIEARTYSAKVYHRLFPRIGHCHDAAGDVVLYLERGTPAWDAIEIDHNGWRLIDQAPVKFIRPEGGIGELPLPERGGTIDDLEQLINLRSRRDFILSVGWILGCYQPANPYLQALLMGAHGSAKTSAMKRLCSLIDPIFCDPLAPPREDRDVLVVAQATFVQAFDNAKKISSERSAIYCRLSTGGGQRGRVLYTDKGEYGLWARRPLIQTSTRMVVKEPDHADRTVIIGMGRAFEDENEGKRKTEALLDAEFIKVWPKLFGCILDAVVEGLRRQRAKEPTPAHLPRMADFAVWAGRCETGLGWPPGTILTAYRAAIEEYAQDIAELDSVASATIAFMLKHPDGWKGTVTLLLALLGQADGGRAARSRDWPRNAMDLSIRLRELGSVFFRNSLLLDWRRNRGERQLVMLFWIGGPSARRPNGFDEMVPAGSVRVTPEADQPDSKPTEEGPILL